MICGASVLYEAIGLQYRSVVATAASPAAAMSRCICDAEKDLPAAVVTPKAKPAALACRVMASRWRLSLSPPTLA